jgi:hypothetical protein
MQIRLYFDEDAMDSDLVHALRMHGVDVTTALDEGLIEPYDKDHLAFAASQNRALYSFNAGDYLALHSAYLTQGRLMPASFLPCSNATASASRCAACSGSFISDQPKPCKIKLSF